MEHYSSNIKNIQEKQSLKKVSYFPGNRNPKEAFHISRNETFQSTQIKFLILKRKHRKNLLHFLKRKLILIFQKAETKKKFLIFQETETFLYFRKKLSKLKKIKRNHS